MKVLVTGGNGFIGQHVCEDLESKGHSVVVLDRQGFSQSSRETQLGDVRDTTAVTEAAAHVDAVIHLAAVLGTQETIGNPKPSAETNILGSLNVFEAANQYGLPVVYAGVGNHWMRNYGTGSYTISKTAAEDFARMFNSYRGGKIAIVRPVNAYGPRQSIAAPYGYSKVRKIIPSLVCRALAGDPIEVYGDGTQISDCVWVKDVASVFVAALEYTAEQRNPPAAPIEVGPRGSNSVNSVVELVQKAVCTRMGTPPVPVRHLPMRPGEVPNAVVSADTSTLAQVGISEESFLPLSVGLERTVEYYAENWLPGWKS